MKLFSNVSEVVTIRYLAGWTLSLRQIGFFVEKLNGVLDLSQAQRDVISDDFLSRNCWSKLSPDLDWLFTSAETRVLENVRACLDLDVGESKALTVVDLNTGYSLIVHFQARSDIHHLNMISRRANQVTLRKGRDGFLAIERGETHACCKKSD